ncbi:MAG: DNA mismatch repair endonuclease MutL, partial [Nitrospirota bacterium]|nr:DNA mismatch repair endonuclease MutL [Nitrospirota bacterium]
MAQIKIIPHDLRNKIAAGEVIERPASVVKELIENSIDAGSTDIKIEVLYGGKRLIKVSDNGTGMDSEDALLCFERYATSKLFSEEDLFNIRTMGFRGEALSSIASVSKVKLVTAPKDISQGVSIEIHGGEVKAVKDSPSFGTTVEVKDLFFNTPARKKFLKKNTTELLHIIDRVTEEALAHYSIGFTFISDNYETMNIPFASGIRERIMQIYGDEFLDGLIEVNAETENLTIQSFVSKGANFRNSKSHQFLFINRRPIRDPSIAHAVYRAYEGMLPHDRHPVFFLFLSIEPGKVDFNVHPTKREVRFEDKEYIYRFVHNAIRDIMRKDRIEYAVQFTEAPSADSIPHFLNISDSSSLPYGAALSEHLELAYKHYLPFI